MKTDFASALVDLRKLENDYALQRDGYTFFCVLTYTELYRYVYPILEYLKAGHETLYFTRQVALRYYMDTRKIQWFILSGAFMQYQYEVLHAQERISEALQGRDYNWTHYDAVVSKILSEAGKVSSIHTRLADKGLSLPETRIEEAFLSAVKSAILKQEYHEGLEAFEKLVHSTRLRSLSWDREAEIERDPDFKGIKQDYLDSLPLQERARPSSTDLNLADTLAHLAYLNRNAARSKQLFVMIAEDNPSKEATDNAELTDILLTSRYGSKFPMIRSLSYCLYDAFYHATAGDDFEVLRTKVEGLRKFAETELGKTVEDFGKLADMALKPEIQEKLAAINREIEEINRRARQLPVYREFQDAVENHVKQRLGLEKTPDAFVAASHLRQSLIDLLNDPSAMFGPVTREYDVLLRDLRHRIMQLRERTRLLALGTDQPPTFGSYSDQALTPYEREQLGEEILRLHIRLQSCGEDSWAVYDEIEGRAQHLLRKHNNRSPALYVLLAGCERRRRRFPEALALLDIAESVEGWNPEISYERANCYVKSRDLTDDQAMKSNMLDQALTESRRFLDNENSPRRPMYFQYVAYIHWMLFGMGSDEWHTAESPSGRAHIEEASLMCWLALDMHFEKTREHENVYNRISSELAYYYALLGDKERLEKARGLVTNLKKDEMPQAQLDSKAFVYLKCYVCGLRVPKLDFLQEAVRLYELAIARRGKSHHLIEKGLSWAIKELHARSLDTRQ